MQTQAALALSAALTSLEHAANLLKKDTNDTIAKKDPVELVRHFDQVRQANAAIKKARKVLEEIEDRLSTVDIPDLFRAAKIKTINVEDLGRVSVSYKWYCSIVDGMKPNALQWLRETGNGGIITETIPWQSLSSFARTETEVHGRDVPDELFKTTITPFTSITKA